MYGAAKSKACDGRAVASRGACPSMCCCREHVERQIPKTRPSNPQKARRAHGSARWLRSRPNTRKPSRSSISTNQERLAVVAMSNPSTARRLSGHSRSCHGVGELVAAATAVDRDDTRTMPVGRAASAHRKRAHRPSSCRLSIFSTLCGAGTSARRERAGTAAHRYTAHQMASAGGIHVAAACSSALRASAEPSAAAGRAPTGMPVRQAPLVGAVGADH